MSVCMKSDLTLEQWSAGVWQPSMRDLQWVTGLKSDDGLYLEQGGTSKAYLVAQRAPAHLVMAQRRRAGVPELILIREKCFKYQETIWTVEKTWPSRDLTQVLVATNVQAGLKYTYTALYWVFNVATQEAAPLHDGNSGARIQTAHWSPQGRSIAYVLENDVFVRDLRRGLTARVTTRGSPSLLYGVPDWIYENEIFCDSHTLRWSSNGRYLAFLALDESHVGEYPLVHFIRDTKGSEAANCYPEIKNVHYPRPGTPNPTVGLIVYDCVTEVTFPMDAVHTDDRLITEFLWMGSTLLVRTVNRTGDHGEVILFAPSSQKSRVIRSIDSSRLGTGWIDVPQTSLYVPADSSKGRHHDGYIERVMVKDRNRLGYFAPLDARTPVVLTDAAYEVDGPARAVDLETNTVYFCAGKRSPTERYVYCTSLLHPKVEPMGNNDEQAFYDISFSPHCGYALLSYEGPGVPKQDLVSVRTYGVLWSIERNLPLSSLVRSHRLPERRFGTVSLHGSDFDYVERLPLDFCPAKRYPVLFSPYQGPGSRSVSQRFQVDFQQVLAATHECIVVTVDGRGTALRGRRMETSVRGQLGHWESHDQVQAGKLWSKKPYVDGSRMAIWGWSYGGYTALKVLERDQGNTFQYGMAVAPVTDWRLYESVYTERYMGTPDANAEGYQRSAVHDMPALAKVRRILLLHGLADDNVHVQHTLSLAQKMTAAGLVNFDVHLFPDSDHDISFQNANEAVYRRKSFGSRPIAEANKARNVALAG